MGFRGAMCEFTDLHGQPGAPHVGLRVGPVGCEHQALIATAKVCRSVCCAPPW